MNKNEPWEWYEEVFRFHSAAEFVAKQQLAQQQARTFSIAKNNFSYPVGTRIFREGDMGDAMFILLEGLKEFAATQGEKVFTGTKINVRDFAFRANYRLGVPEARIPAIVDKLVPLGRIRVAAHGPDEVIVAL